MTSQDVYGAPWGTTLIVMTLFVCVTLIGITVLGYTTGPREMLMWTLNMKLLPLLILVGGMLFTVRGYTIDGNELLVKRLVWQDSIDLSGLVSATPDPEAMKNSIRTFGNGGMFAFCGKFSNKKLGSYRAFVTDAKNSVVLKFHDRTIVVSPHDPEAFTSRIRENTGF